MPVTNTTQHSPSPQRVHLQTDRRPPVCAPGPRTALVFNALTIDVEDWIQSVYDLNAPLTDWFCRNTGCVLEHLASRRVTATFFVLGLAAKKAPQLVRDIQNAGHEIQSHGFGHRPAYTQTAKEFREDIASSKALLEDLTGTPIIGYRAPMFSIDRRNLWALDVLADCGFVYDSSIFPVKTRRYGIAGAPNRPHHLRLPTGASLIEIPVATYRAVGRTLPMGGGGYIRLFPFSMISRAVRQLNVQRQPAVLYMHPYEYNPSELRRLPIHIPLPLRIHQTVGRAGFRAKIDRLLSEFRFGSIEAMLRQCGTLRSHEYTDAVNGR